MVLKVCTVNVITSLNTLVDEYVNTCLVVIGEICFDSGIVVLRSNC